MGDSGAGSVQAEPIAPGSTPSTPIEPFILRFAVLTYLALLPVGHLFEFPVNGAMAVGSDGLLALVLLAAAVDLARVSGPYFRGGGDRLPVLPQQGVFHMAALLMWVFSAWVGLGALWSFYPAYATTKGLAFAALGLGALAILWCGAEWGKAADAWLWGTALCLLVTWGSLLVGPEALQSSMLYTGGSVRGLPLPRISGPFLHPNMFGDYLVVSGGILFARWGSVREAWGLGAVAAASVLVGTLLLTISSAWLGAGVLLTALGLLTMRQRDGGLSIQRNRPGPVILVVVGVVLFTMTLAGLLLPMGFDVGGLSITGSGIRPAIWASAWEAFLEAPIGGIGASPVWAVAADPLTGAVASWDAHNVYLSVLGQFGLFGTVLFAGAITLLVHALVREGTTRRHAVLVVVLLAVAAHGVVIASEEFRHLWALLGLVGLAGVPQWAQGQWWREEASSETEGSTDPVADEVAAE